MKLIRYPEDINKIELIDEFSSRLLSCMKSGMRSSYDIVITPENDSSWYKYLNINLDKGVRYIILVDEQIVRGYLVWHNHNDDVHIYDLVISPDYQCDGVSLRRLLKSFAQDVSDSEYSKLVAYTNFKNDRMNGLLKRQGFSVSEIKARGTVYTTDINKFIKKFK